MRTIIASLIGMTIGWFGMGYILDHREENKARAHIEPGKLFCKSTGYTSTGLIFECEVAK